MKVMKNINFPKDENSHDNIIEWWYWNGHLKGDDGRDYAFMDCLFKADTRRAKIPFLKTPLKNFYFSHSILSDISNQKFYPIVDYISLLSRQSFKRPLLFAEYVCTDILSGFSVNLMKENPLFEYRLKTENFDLKMKSQKTPLLLGGNGSLNLHGRKTYYYSLSDLSVEGEIFVKGKAICVSGKAWMDHQWANAPYNKDRWTWFSIQLDNNIELICFEYGNKKKDAVISISYPDGRQEHFKKAVFTPVGSAWKSSKTGASYELSWQIEIPEKKIVLFAEPMIKKQEMIFGKINYWEGPMSFKGSINGRSVTGKGFMELVGRHSRYGTVSLAKDLFKAGINKGLKKIWPKRK